MVTSLIICGGGSLPRDDDDHGRSIQSAGSSPRKSSSSSSSSSTRRCKSHNHHHHKNPYAARGLDKFSSLLAEIEEKKRMIYSANNPDDICFVQFDYSKNNHCKPIVIKVKPNKADKAEINPDQPDHHLPAPPPPSTDLRDRHRDLPVTKKRSLLRRLKLQRLRKPSCYLPAMVILILVFLVVFGRTVAILCTSIGWYAIPAISRRKPNSMRSLEKKGSMVAGLQGRG